jgi:superfamily II DNA or RNA helicase
MSLELRPYQVAAVNSVFESWRQFNRVLGVGPTGSGKTIKFAAIAQKRLDVGRVLILAHRDELIDQAIDKLYCARRLSASKEKANDRASLDAGIVVASVPTLARQERHERFSRDHFSTIVVDEAHHVLADSYQRILRHFDGQKVLGVTATPDRGDTRALGEYFEDIAFEISLIDLICAKYLCPVSVRTVPVRIDISGVSTRAGDFSEEGLAGALEPVLEDVADGITNYAAGRKILVFVPLVRIAVQFAQILRARGFAAETISGACCDRAEKLARFKTCATQCLVNAMLLTEGFDEPSIDCVVCLRPTKIRAFYAHMVGRGTRTCSGKENLLLLDFLWISRRHNLARPASLVAHDETEQAALETVLAEANGDLVGALDMSRERALARQLLARRKFKGEVRDLLDILDICVAFRAPELENYAPTMRWHAREPTEKQPDFLRAKRIDLSSVQDRGHASAIIDTIIRYNEKIPATPKQLRYLHCLGYRGDVSALSKPAASRLINQLKERVEAAARS